MNAPDDSIDREAIHQLRATWLDAMARGDVDVLTTMRTDDYEVWTNATPPLVGPSGDWAFERGFETLDVTPIGGGTAEDVTTCHADTAPRTRCPGAMPVE